MPKFLAVHTMPGPSTTEDVAPMVRELVKGETVNAYWVRAWGQNDEEGKFLKFFCEWNAENEKAVRDVFAKVPEFPLDGVYPMTKIDSEDFRE